VTVLEDLKKLRRTRWSRLVWPSDCPTLAGHLSDAASALEARAALVDVLSAVEGRLGSEASLIRYSHRASAVLMALLGLDDDTAERGADERYETASRIAAVPIATLKTRDGNLLLDGFARALSTDWQPGGLGATTHGAARPGSSRGRSLESLVRKALLELSPAFGESAWQQGCQPILAIEDDPRRLRREVSYTAGIEYRKLGASYCYQVTSSFRSLRVLPPVDVVDVVFCRTTAALEQEYRKPATISVELCEFGSDVWKRTAAHELATDLHVGSDRCRQADIDRDTDRTRLRFGLPDLPTDSLHVPVTVRNTYLVPASSRVYPIRLGDYFTVGPCEMSVTLIDPRAESLDAFVYFTPGPSGLPRDTVPGVPEVERFLMPEGARQQTVRVRSPRGTLLWPYSGADFVWRRR
jgi:hypothetical protein